MQLRSSLFLLLILPFATVVTYAADDTTETRPSPATGGIERHKGLIVDSIVIDNRNMFDTDSERYRHFIFRLANKLHYKTRRIVIRRELLLRVGEPFSPELAEETARNLRLRLALYDAWVETETLPNGHLLVRIVTLDEWSLSGGLDISRESNKLEYRLALAERNLLGNNQYLSSEYRVRSSDVNYSVVTFADRRFLGAPFAVSLGYGDDPRSRFRRFSVNHPFYNLLQTFSFGISVATTGGRREIRHDSDVAGWSNNDGDRFEISGACRIGSYRRKIRISAQYVYRYERSFDKTVVDTTAGGHSLAEASFPSDSLYHQLGGALQLSNLDFIKLREIDGFGYTEDFVVGQALQVRAARALTSDFRDYLFDVIGLNVSEGFQSGSNLAFFACQKTLWFRRDNTIRQVTRLSTTYYRRALNFLTIAARGLYVSDSRDGCTEALAVGGKGDIRGFDEFLQTGDRKGVFNLEGRFYPNVGILSVLFGGTVFVEAARAWKSEEPLGLKGFYASAGVGLRVALERSSKNRLLRLDLARSDKYGWQFSIGVDQYFKVQPAGFLLTSP